MSYEQISESSFLSAVLVAPVLYFVSFLLNRLSYRSLKKKTIQRQKWDLNVCCGKTDGGGINADIIKHGDVPNFVLVEDVYNLPFPSPGFGSILCSHTIEHVDDPQRFQQELRGVGKQITYILPPLWDITAAFNVLEHKWVFLTFVKEHRSLPKYIKLPFAWWIQKRLGQKVSA